MATNMPLNPHLTKPLLHVETSLAASDGQIMAALHECLRARPIINRDEASNGLAKGTIEFELVLNAEKAYAIAREISFIGQPDIVKLSICQDPGLDPKPTAKPRLAKHLPPGYMPGNIFDLFRKFGPLHRVGIQLSPDGRFSGLAVIEYYEEGHALDATKELHFSELEGNSIAIQTYEISRGPIRGMQSWAAAPPFVPANRSVSAGASVGRGMPSALSSSQWTPQRHTTDYGAISPYTSPETSPRHVIYDPTNLFVKGLHPLISSQDLFGAFKNFGRIISARVMRDERTGNSKEFGFVSFSRPEEAATAQLAMDAAPLYGQHGSSESISVRFHEPKKPREYRPRSSFQARERANSYDQEANLADDISKRVTGFSPVSSPRMPSSPINASNSVLMLRSASMSSSGSSSPPSIAGLPMALPPPSEYDRVYNAVRRLGALNAEAITNLLMTLPKRDRALALFINEILQIKVQEAAEVLSAQEDGSLVGDVTKQFESTTISKQSSTSDESPQTVEELAKLPASQIIALANSDRPPAALAASNPVIVKQTDDFFDSLQDKDVSEKKQRLGEKLFKVIKNLGCKNAPKLTIHLLDTEDSLRALGK